MANQVVWADIPVVNLYLAIQFYSAMIGAPARKEAMPGMTNGSVREQLDRRKLQP